MSDATVVRQFEDQVQHFPNAIAIRDGAQEISYRALNEKANQIAAYLKDQGVTAQDFVAILLESSIDFIACMLAINKIGAAYLPLDTAAPKNRLNDILEDANPKLVITSNQFKSLCHDARAVKDIKDILIECSHLPSINSRHALLPTTPIPICMMYTSGSTGKPKGVIITHQAVVNLSYINNLAQIKKQETVAQFSNPAFDAYTYEIWGTLLNRATLVIIPIDVRTDANKLSAFFIKNSIDYLFLPTAYFHQLSKSSPSTLDTIPKILFGGEQVNLNIIKNFIQYRQQHSLPITLINGYGPTEATTFTCCNIITDQTTADNDVLSSVGKPFQNIKTYILDEHMQPADEGELYISGINLALGYHNSIQNQEKFMDNPFSNEEPYLRLYKTGDKARFLPNGEILCLGRLDDQVKIGGFRIHLHEIEQTVMTFPNITQATVLMEMGGSQHKMLTAYIVLTDKSQVIHAEDIRSFLGASLPAYMLPAKYVMVENLPLTLVGKVDKSKLSQIPHTDLSFHIDSSASRPIEKAIQHIWCHLLNRSLIDIHKNFFDLGANSLLITESCALLNQELHAELTIADILSHPTIYKLSRYLEGDVQIQSPKKHKAAITSTDIAIIGMSCRFPKANSLAQFWENLCNQVDCLERFDITNNEDIDKENHVPVRGILSDIESFDASFFGFNPIDASITDPQHRVFLEVAWEALEHAGVAPQKSSSKTISVFAGMTDSSYLQENLLKNNWFLSEYDHFQQRIASSIGMLSTQLSYRLNLKGRSINVNTACSTGLIAVDQACQDLMLGDSDIALAGASSIVVPQQQGYHYQQGSIVSPNGVCAPFSDKANGTVFSNGIGVVILKRLEDAIVEGDTIYAVIKGRGVNNDGSDKLGYTAPSHSGQLACILSALEQSKLKAEDVHYIEAHGTGTHLGDIVEFDALKDAFKTHTKQTQFCTFGTVKANIGHTDVTAGIAGLIKTALCLHHQRIPPMPHYENPNPELGVDKSPFVINKDPITWDNQTAIRHAGISAFGVGGTNIHMILSEYRPLKKTTHKKPKLAEQLIILSAKSPQALEDMTDNVMSYLSMPEHNTPAFLQRAAFTLQTGREDFEYRRYAIGQDSEEIKRSFASPIQHCNQTADTNIVFMFPGQGTQYPQMAQELMRIPYFANIVKTGATLASKHLNCDFLSLLQAENSPELNETHCAQPALFIIEYALAKLLIHYGIQPNAFIGHSLGEYVAACLADVFSFEDGVGLICERALLMASATKGAMLAIECSIEDFEKLQKSVKGIELALHNSHEHCVASGTLGDIEALEKHLKIHHIPYQQLNVSHAFHSRLMDSIKDNFIELLSNTHFNAPSIPIISNLTGDWLSAKDAVDPQYWYRHLRHTVKLKEGLQVLAKDTNSFFIEVGPKRSLSYYLKSVLTHCPKQDHTIIHSLSGSNDYHQLLALIGLAWMKSIPVDWSKVHPSLVYKTSLPTYAFQKEKYWIEPDKQLNSSKIRCYQPAWTHQKIYLENRDWETSLKKHTWVIIKDAFGLADTFVSFLKRYGVEPFIVSYGETYSYNEFDFKIHPNQKEHYQAVIKDITDHCHQPIFLNITSYGLKTDTLLSVDHIEKQLHDGFYSLLYLSQALVKTLNPSTQIKIGIITSGTQQPVGTECLNPLNGMLTGAAQVIAQEHPNLKFKLFDFNQEEEISDLLIYKTIESCIHTAWGESFSIKAYRNQQQWHLFFNEVRPNKHPFNRLRDKGVYMLTGGLGGIALSCCAAIAETISNPTFILLSRSTIPLKTEWEDISNNPSHTHYAQIKPLIKLEQLGATLHIQPIDITNLEALKALTQRCIQQYGAIHGLIHTAGVANSALMHLKTKASVQETFAPKIQGTDNLIKIFENIPLDFVILKSSLAAVLGGFGQVDYAAANAYLDVVAISGLFKSSAFTASINWNTWRDVGIAARNQKEGKPSFIGKGNDISTAEGKKLFLEALQGDVSQIAISRMDINNIQAILMPNLPNPPKISRDKLSTHKNYAAPRNELESKLLQLWQESLGIEGFSINDDFFAFGGHSLLAISLIEKINKALKCNLSMTQIYSTPTIEDLSAFIAGNLKTDKTPIIVSLKNISPKAPNLFLVHPISGLINCFDPFVKQSTLGMSIYGLQDPSINQNRLIYDTLNSMVEDYLLSIKAIQPTGPYYLIGYSFGGIIAYELAHKLKLSGEDITFLGLIDSWAINPPSLQNEIQFKNHILSEHPDLPEAITHLAWEREKLVIDHALSQTNQDIVLFKATQQLRDYEQYETITHGWEAYNTGSIMCHSIEGTHQSILNPENSADMLGFINSLLSSVRTAHGGED